MLTRAKHVFEQVLREIGRRLPPKPNVYTLAALPVASLCPVVVLLLPFEQACYAALVLGALAAVLDVVDGLVARAHGCVTKLGAFLDSTCDRIVDFVLLLSLYLLLKDSVTRLVIVLLMFLSGLISYTRARAESLGVSLAGVGLIERPERLLAILVLLALLPLLPVSLRLQIAQIYLVVLTMLSAITAAQRCVEAARRLRLKA